MYKKSLFASNYFFAMVDLFQKGCSNVGVGMTSMFKTSFIWTGQDFLKIGKSNGWMGC